MRLPLCSASVLLALTGPVLAQPASWQLVLLHPPGATSSEVAAIRGGVQYGTITVASTQNSQSGFWNGSAGTWTALSDPSEQSTLHAADATQQIGQLGFHACLWHGTSLSFVDLNPSVPALDGTNAFGVSGNQQVGGAFFIPNDVPHAALWYGTAASFVDLHPAGAKRSLCAATDGTLQGGYLIWVGTFDNHAAIWQGTPGSVIDLNPPNSASQVKAMVPGVQVGYVTTTAGDFAAVWHGSAGSFVNLGPPGVTLSKFFATTGTVHAGVMGQGGLSRAAVNFGTPSSWVGLQQFLPPPYAGYSQANAIYQDGPTIYVGGWAQNGATGQTEAILWIGTLPCYANCDQSTVAPILNANDFQCFLNKFVTGDASVNCDGSAVPPILNANDFQCFLNRFAAGCT